MRKIDHTPEWRKIMKAAKELGASEDAVKKWWQRRVPPEWRIKIVQHTGGMVSFQDFRDIDKGEWKE